LNLAGLQEILRELDLADVETEAVQRYGMLSSHQARLSSQYEFAHGLYAPPGDGDQWAWDRTKRPGKLHITANIVRAFVDVLARVEAILPRLTLLPNSTSQPEQVRAELVEQVMLMWLEMSGWEVWMPELTQTKHIYGKAILRVFWNKRDNRPDAHVVENPANLRIGWGSSDYRQMDWAIYESLLSPEQVLHQYPMVEITSGRTGSVLGRGAGVALGSGDHSDPLGQRVPLPGMTQDQIRSVVVAWQPSDYEQNQMRIWDYWYKDFAGVVSNATLVEGQVVAGPTKHPYLPDIPYIVIENDHEPGSPEGLSTVIVLGDIQIELNRALSHWAQLVADEIDPSWVLEGENADTVAEGMVPKGGEIIAAGSGNQIRALEKPVSTIPVAELVAGLWSLAHKLTGAGPIMFGEMPNADSSGRAIAIQIESIANRMDPRRRRVYHGLRELMAFWTHMVRKLNPKVPVMDEEGAPRKLGMRQVFEGFFRWRIIAPEITPRDIDSHVTTVANKVGAKLIAVETGMDEIGVESPKAEIGRIRNERMDPNFFPQDAQAYLGVLTGIQALQQTQMAMQSQVAALAAPNQPVSPTDQGGINAVLAAQQQMAPTLDESANPPPPQPLTQEGSPPPPGAPPPSVATTSLIRGTAGNESQTLNQIAIKRNI